MISLNDIFDTMMLTFKTTIYFKEEQFNKKHFLVVLNYKQLFVTSLTTEKIVSRNLKY